MWKNKKGDFLIMKLTYLFIILLVCSIFSSGCDKIENVISSNQIDLYCDTTENKDCLDTIKQYKRNCTNSKITLDSDLNIIEMTLKKTDTHCKFYEKVIGSIAPELEGVYLDCNIPLSKLDLFADSTGLDETNIWKYCTGDLKEKTFDMLN